MRARFGENLRYCLTRRAGLSLAAFAACVLVAVSIVPHSDAGLAANVQPRPTGVIVDTPTITITAATATTMATPTTPAHEAQIIWTFGNVSGSYSTCTVQAETTFDGATWLTLGSVVSVTVASGAVNAWTILAQAPSSSGVATGAVSSSAALGFGLETDYVFACSSYGTSAPVSISVIYR
jgi:hypothetical protein